ncbi:Cell death protease [Microbotryomycetes sp. JL221]|nr:Cell death protease [Microbotryomycetes sp. JL221]
MYAGHLPSAPPQTGGVKDTDSNAHLFFFMVKAKHIADTERTILWFNGGPGCSSFDGSLMEVGPVRLVPGGKGELHEIDGAWNEYANVIFIDQPVGTGYSFAATNKYVHELAEAADHVVEFLSQFYRVFPEFSKHDTYIAGESYFGQYGPYFTRAIMDSSRLTTKLKGLIIGNGWIDPYNQYPSYLDFSLKSGIIKQGSAAETRVLRLVKNCQERLDKMGIDNVKIHNGACENILSAVTDSTIQSVNGQSMCVNNYDVRLTDTHPACGMNWPPDLADITPYLQRQDVKNAFHAGRKDGGWTECNGQVGSNFWVVKSKPAVHLLPDLLKRIPILMFAGDQDLICNHVGIERMIDNLEWNGQKGFGNATEQDWFVNGEQAGTWTSARNLTYVKVADASHMVPYDVPLVAHDMLLRFVGVDLLGAAGPAAQVPSRVGDEQEAVLGSTHPNGTAVTPVGLDSSSSNTVGTGSDIVDLKDGSSTLDGSSSGSGSSIFHTSSTVETIANVGSALVIIALMGVGLLLFCVIKRRLGSRSGSSGGGVARALGHSRKRSTGRGQAVQVSDSRDDHELDELVKGRDADDDDDDEFDRMQDVDLEKGKNRPATMSHEQIFDVGEEDEDDERKAGDIGRVDRR